MFYAFCDVRLAADNILSHYVSDKTDYIANISYKYKFFHYEKGGAYSAASLISVSPLNRKVILLPVCTVADFKNETHSLPYQVTLSGTIKNGTSTLQ